MRGRWELSDAQWELIEPILRPKRRSDGRGRPWQDPRAVLNGILWVLGTGAQWRELPKKYPPYQTCHRRFQQWVRTGTLEHSLRVLAEELQARGKLDWEEAFIDASFTGAKKGASRSGPPDAAKGRKSSLSLIRQLRPQSLECQLHFLMPEWMRGSPYCLTEDLRSA